MTGGSTWSTLPVYLDTDKDTRPSIDDSSNEMFLETWTDEVVYDLSFPLTDKNYRTLNPLLSGGSFDLKPKELDITMVYNTNIMGQDKMRASINGFHKDGRFYVTVYNSQSFAKKSKELLLKDIELEQVVFHSDNSNNFVNALPKGYVDNGLMYRYPLDTMYKSLHKGWFLDCDYQRPYVFLLPLLRKGFLQLGYSFKSPFLESPIGRRILCYLLDDDLNEFFGKKDLTFKPYGIRGTSQPNLTIIHEKPYKFNQGARVDKNGFYYMFLEDKLNLYSNNCNCNVDIRIGSFKGQSALSEFGPITANTVDVIFRLYLGEEIIDEQEISVTSGALVPEGWFYSYFGNLNINRQNSLSIRYKVLTKDAYLIIDEPSLAGGQRSGPNSVKLEMVKQRIPNLAEYDLNKILNKTSLFELLRGASQLFSGYLDIDATGRVLTLFTAFDEKIYEYELEGYYKIENQILKNLARNGSEIVLPTEESYKYVELGFKPLIEREEIQEEGSKKSGLYGTFLDMGNDITPNTRNLRNTYFEPTENKAFDFGSMYKIGDKEFKETFIPLVVGEEDGTMQNVGKRILISYAKDDFERLDDENSTKEKFPKVQYSKATLLYNVFSAYQQLPKEYILEEDYEVFDLVYDTEIPNLYSLMRAWIIANNFKQIARVDVMFTPLDFLNFNKRKGYSFYKKDTWITGTFVSMTDYKPCEDSIVTLELGITDPLTFKPAKLSQIDALVGRKEENEFDFEIVKVADCTYSIEESNPNSLDVIYYWYYTDESEEEKEIRFLDAVDPEKDFYVVAIILDVEVYQIYKEQKVCPEIESIAVVEVEETHKLTILNLEDIDTISYELTETNKLGEDEVVTYDGDYESRPSRPIEDLLEVCYRNIVVVKKCGCGEEEYDDICWQFELNCDSLEVSLEIINEDRTYKAVRVDNIECCIAQDLIFYKTKLDDPYELLRLEETIYANEVWFKRVVIFNNDACTTKVFEIKASEDVFS